MTTIDYAETTETAPEVAEPTVTDEQIEGLRAEAEAAGDAAMVSLCDRALSGDASALSVCCMALDSAAAMDDGEDA